MNCHIIKETQGVEERKFAKVGDVEMGGGNYMNIGGWEGSHGIGGGCGYTFGPLWACAFDVFESKADNFLPKVDTPQ